MNLRNLGIGLFLCAGALYYVYQMFRTGVDSASLTVVLALGIMGGIIIKSNLRR